MSAGRWSATRLLTGYDALLVRHEQGAAADAGFDAGEWSGPLHAEALERETATPLAEAGWTETEWGMLCSDDPYRLDGGECIVCGYATGHRESCPAFYGGEEEE